MAGALVRELHDAFKARDWVRLRSLYHPDARLHLALDPEAPVGPDEATALFRRAADDIVFVTSFDRIIEIEPGRCAEHGDTLGIPEPPA